MKISPTTGTILTSMILNITLSILKPENIPQYTSQLLFVGLVAIAGLCLSKATKYAEHNEEKQDERPRNR